MDFTNPTFWAYLIAALIALWLGVILAIAHDERKHKTEEDSKEQPQILPDIPTRPFYVDLHDERHRRMRREAHEIEHMEEARKRRDGSNAHAPHND